MMIFITMEVKKESEHFSPDHNLDTMTEGPLKLRYKWTLFFLLSLFYIKG